MKHRILGTLLALTLTAVSGTIQPAAAAATEAETEIGAGEHTSPTECPTGQQLYRVYCLTHQTHEFVCM